MRKPCCVTVKQDSNNKGAWSKQEDEKLSAYIRKHGEGCWRTLPQAADLLRCGKSCRLRWINYLRPDLKRDKFGEDEEDLIIKLHALLGNRWSLIAGRLPGRTDNEVKNYYNSHLRRKLINMGIDPNNHRLGRNITNIQRLQNTQNSAGATSSTAINIKYTNNTFYKTKNATNAISHGHVDDDEQVSDAGSCLEDNNHDLSSSVPALPDLNLDPTIGTSVSTDHIDKQGDVGTDHNANESNLSSELDCSAAIGRLPTLLLFQ